MGLLIRWWHRLTARWRPTPVAISATEAMADGASAIAPPVAPPDPLPRQVPPPHMLDAICTRFGAQYMRSTFATGEVQVTLVREQDTLSGRGHTTADAVADVVKKATQLWGDPTT